jgi:DNA helicase-2/ATP-dependent DNA helicase PcrA
VVTLTDTLSRLTGRDPHANIAIIARTPLGAAHFFDMVKHLPATRLIEDGEFPFAPGIDVTHVGQVKGLEFDYVIIPDADPYRYPDTPLSRRHLHVAATRAIHQLWVTALGDESPILKDARA